MRLTAAARVTYLSVMQTGLPDQNSAPPVIDGEAPLVRQSFADGLVDLVAGVLFVLQAVAFYYWRGWHAVLAMATANLWLMCMPWTLRKLRERLTYPRVGYAKAVGDFPRKWDAPVQHGAVAVSVLVAFVLLFAVASWWEWKLRWMPPLAVLVYSIGLAYGARQTGFRRFYFPAAVAMCSFAWAAWVGVPERTLAVTSGAIGGSLVLTGVLTLMRFLRLPRQVGSEP
jgi:hypothetical protein